MNDMAHAVLRLLEDNKIEYTLAEHPAVFNMEELYARGWNTAKPLPKTCWFAIRKNVFTGCWCCMAKNGPI